MKEEEKQFNELINLLSEYTGKPITTKMNKATAKRRRLFMGKLNLHTLKEFVEQSPDSCIKVLVEDDDMFDNIQDFILAVALKEQDKKK